MADFSNSTDSTQPPPTHHHVNFTRIFLDGFLAFLLVLLVTASIIVLRSFMIHRWSRSRLQDPLEAGVVFDTQGNLVPVRPKRIGEKPMIWEVWVDGHNKDDQSGEFGHPTLDDGRRCTTPWKTILPISARPIPPNELKSLDVTANTLHNQNLSRLPTSRKSDESSSSTSFSVQKLEVSVLISMPTPNRRVVQGQYATTILNSKDITEESEIPEVAFGITNVFVHS